MQFGNSSPSRQLGSISTIGDGDGSDGAPRPRQAQAQEELVAAAAEFELDFEILPCPDLRNASAGASSSGRCWFSLCCVSLLLLVVP